MNIDHLKESAKEYIEKYPVRLSQFLNEFEASETDFIEKEIEYFDNTIYDLKNSESSHDGYSITGIHNFTIAYNLATELGWDKLNYSTKRKIDFLESKKALTTNALQPKQMEPKSDKLSDLITHTNSVQIVESIKVQYKNIKGKELKLLLMAFQELNLLPKERISSKFHTCCKGDFNWKIASYNAMNGYTYNDNIDNVELESMKTFIKTLTKQQ